MKQRIKGINIIKTSDYENETIFKRANADGLGDPQIDGQVI